MKIEEIYPTEKAINEAEENAIPRDIMREYAEFFHNNPKLIEELIWGFDSNNFDGMTDDEIEDRVSRLKGPMHLFLEVRREKIERDDRRFFFGMEALNYFNEWYFYSVISAKNDFASSLKTFIDFSPHIIENRNLIDG